LPNSVAAAESWREEFSALRKQRLSGPYPLGALPLRVLERDVDSTDTRHAQQVQLAGLSSKGNLAKAGQSGHLIHLQRPDLVIEGIDHVVQDVRRAR